MITRSLASLTIRRRLIVLQTTTFVAGIGTQLACRIGDWDDDPASATFTVNCDVVGRRGCYLLCSINVRNFDRWLRERGHQVVSLKSPQVINRILVFQTLMLPTLASRKSIGLWSCFNQKCSTLHHPFQGLSGLRLALHRLRLLHHCSIPNQAKIRCVIAGTNKHCYTQRSVNFK